MTTIKLHDQLTDRIDEVRGDTDRETFVQAALYDKLGSYEAEADEDGSFRVVGAFDVVYATGLDEETAERHAEMLNHSIRAMEAMHHLVGMVAKAEKGDPRGLISDAHIAVATMEETLLGRYRDLDDIKADNETAAKAEAQEDA